MNSLSFLRSTAIRLPVFLLCCIQAFAAELTHEQLDAAKQATAVVLQGEHFGTAFCISETGLFVARNSVVDGTTGGRLSIVLDPGGKSEKKYPARILRQFTGGDLAVLKVDLDRKVPALKFGDDAGLVETQPLFVFGYSLAHVPPENEPLPSIDVGLGRIRSLRRKGDELVSILVDAKMGPGNAGGPVLDDQGNVVGIVTTGIVVGGLNFATPIADLKKAMNDPLIEVVAPTVPYEKRFEPAEFIITANWLVPPPVEPVAAIELTSEGQTRRAAATKGADGKYRARVAPMLPKVVAVKGSLQVAIEFADGRMTGSVEDFPLAFNGVKKPLSEIRVIERKTPGGPFLLDGVPGGDLPELAKLNINVGGTKLTMDGQKAKRMEIAIPARDPEPTTYRALLAIGNGNNVLTSARGTLSFGGAPVSASVVPEPIVAMPQLQPGEPFGGTKSFDLPSVAEDVVAAGGGRFLVFHLKDIKKLAVFDVVGLKIKGYVNLDEEPVLFAGGLKCLLVASPKQNVIQRISLETLEKEKSISSPFESMSDLVMGYSSPRLALFITGGGSPASSAMQIFDVDKMKPDASTAGDNQFGQIRGERGVTRASADGRTYGFCRIGSSPSGFSVVSYKNDHLSLYYQHDSMGLLIPNADGSLIFTSMRGLYTSKGVPVVAVNGNWSEGNHLIPSYHPMYYIGVPYGSFPAQKKAQPKPIAIYVGKSNQPLVYLPEPFEEMSEKGREGGPRPDTEPITVDRRYHFYPQLNLILTIPPTSDKIVARSLDIQKVLKEKGVDYLYVTSTPPIVRVSQQVHFRLEAASRAGGVTFSLQSGPAGLTVSADGTVNWIAPAKEEEQTVIVALKDASGTEALHTFQMIVTS